MVNYKYNKMRCVQFPEMLKGPLTCVAVIMVGYLVLDAYIGFLQPASIVPLSSLQVRLSSSEEDLSAEGVPWWRKFMCNLPGSSGQQIPLVPLPLPQLLTDETLKTNDNVFMMDTGCNAHPNFRTWCVAESWARQNPDRQVFFILTSPSAENADNLPSLLMAHYPNLRMTGINIERVFQGVPIQKLFLSERWTANNTWPIESMADMLRVAILYHWGGIYTDTDIICIKPFNASVNAVGYETNYYVTNSLYSFTRRHPLLWTLMEYMNTNFKETLWGSLGPQSISHVMTKACEADNIKRPDQPKEPLICGNVTLYPKRFFFPIDYGRFVEKLTDGTGAFAKEFKDSYTIHFFNKLTKNSVVVGGSGGIYEVTAKLFCPVTYRQATLRANVF